MPEGLVPTVLADREGECLWYDGGLLTFKMTGRQTAGTYFLFEALMPRGKATPLHVETEEETFYVLDGEILLHIAGREFRGTPGTVAVIPRGVPHAFVVESETARLLVLFTPAGRTSEAFFRAAGEPAETPTLPPAGHGPDLERLQEAARRTGLKVLGPPPFTSPQAQRAR
jgi:quercetin dioxygenase-like cupin family protein